MRKAFAGFSSTSLTKGEVRYIDPQSRNSDVSCYFDKIKPNETEFVRIDKLDISDPSTAVLRGTDMPTLEQAIKSILEEENVPG